MRLSDRARSHNAAALMNDAEDDRYKYQSCNGCETEAADHGPAERRVLLAAVAESPCSSSFSLAKLMTRTLLAVATPMHMMAPVKAGTDSVVPVVNSIHTMPARAAGSAAMITNGSA